MSSFGITSAVGKVNNFSEQLKFEAWRSKSLAMAHQKLAYFNRPLRRWWGRSWETSTTRKELRPALTATFTYNPRLFKLSQSVCQIPTRTRTYDRFLYEYFPFWMSSCGLFARLWRFENLLFQHISASNCFVLFSEQVSLMPSYGLGIWCSVLYMLTGFLGYSASYRPTKAMYYDRQKHLKFPLNVWIKPIFLFRLVAVAVLSSSAIAFALLASILAALAQYSSLNCCNSGGFCKLIADLITKF